MAQMPQMGGKARAGLLFSFFICGICAICGLKTLEAPAAGSVISGCETTTVSPSSVAPELEPVLLGAMRGALNAPQPWMLGGSVGCPVVRKGGRAMLSTMNLCESPRRSFWIALFSFLASLVIALVTPFPAWGQQPSAGLPEFENEFFNDFSGSVSNSQKIEISRNLRLASEASQIHAMIVVIKKVADYPSLPQEVHAMALQLARDRKVGSQKTHQGLLALFAL